MTAAEIQTLLEENFAPWVLALDLSVQGASPAHTTLRMPLTPQLARVGGIVSGQALAALSDTSMVLATIAHVGEFKPLATTNLDVQFLRPGVGAAILCRAEVVRAGKALIFTRALMTEEDSAKSVATATATFYAP
ncbi:PaaI family thioesterase [Thalassococcus sp. S3]|uniref:PaaI family thioesterase n=1 Tax=Thalassococcus sp. S3 TaxID=2017482 RepID=UPI0010241E8A|nr:PaaI family thioesterase [Thalassococcus sp. S3]QBF32827.1 thioesterase [Thalassococcus sp. S3]